MGFNIQSASTTATQNDYTNFINSFVTNVVNNSSVNCNTNQNYEILLGRFQLVEDSLLKNAIFLLIMET